MRAADIERREARRRARVRRDFHVRGFLNDHVGYYFDGELLVLARIP